MTRKKKLLLNTLTGLLKQAVTVVCGFILPRYMLLYYGSSVNGLISSMANFLSFISLLDMGVGAVVQANLYKPLAERDTDQMSRIIISSERFFRKLAYIFLAYIAVLCVVFSTAIDTSYDTWFTVSLLLIVSASTLAQYLFGMTYQLLLNADQKSYVQLILQIVTIALNTLFSVILMRLGCSVHIVKLTTAALYVLRPLLQLLYVRRHYRINRRVELVGEPIKQKWNGFSQHLAAVVCQNVDIAVLTVFSTLENVSVYSVYYAVTNGVEQIVMTAATGVESLFGDMIARGEKEELSKAFDAVEWITHTGVTVVFTITALTIVPFVSVYTRGITDADYIAPVFGALLVIAYAAQCLRIPYFRVIKAAGHFKQTQNGAYISALINTVLTVALVFRLGLVGAAIGTLAAMAYHTCYCVWYLRNNIMSRPLKPFIRYMITDCVIAAASYFLTRPFVFAGSSYGAWVLLAVKVSCVVVAVALAVNLLLYRSRMADIFGKLIQHGKRG